MIIELKKLELQEGGNMSMFDYFTQPRGEDIPVPVDGMEVANKARARAQGITGREYNQTRDERYSIQDQIKMEQMDLIDGDGLVVNGGGVDYNNDNEIIEAAIGGVRKVTGDELSGAMARIEERKRFDATAEEEAFVKKREAMLDKKSRSVKPLHEIVSRNPDGTITAMIDGKLQTHDARFEYQINDSNARREKANKTVKGGKLSLDLQNSLENAKTKEEYEAILKKTQEFPDRLGGSAFKDIEKKAQAGVDNFEKKEIKTAESFLGGAIDTGDSKAIGQARLKIPKGDKYDYLRDRADEAIEDTRKTALKKFEADIKIAYDNKDMKALLDLQGKMPHDLPHHFLHYYAEESIFDLKQRKAVKFKKNADAKTDRAIKSDDPAKILSVLNALESSEYADKNEESIKKLRIAHAEADEVKKVATANKVIESKISEEKDTLNDLIKANKGKGKNEEITDRIKEVRATIKKLKDSISANNKSTKRYKDKVKVKIEEANIKKAEQDRKDKVGLEKAYTDSGLTDEQKTSIQNSNKPPKNAKELAGIIKRGKAAKEKARLKALEKERVANETSEDRDARWREFRNNQSRSISDFLRPESPTRQIYNPYKF